MICHECGRHIKGKPRTRDYHGATVNLHVKCGKRIAPDVTARATTSETGRTYVDDELRGTADGPVRRVYARPGDRP